jgi:uncharacterized protein
MGKFLSWVVLIALGYLAFRLVAISQRKRDAARRGADARREQAGAAGKVTGEKMVQCAHCGVFLPASDAFVDGDRSYCDRAHRDADRAEQRRA